MSLDSKHSSDLKNDDLEEKPEIGDAIDANYDPEFVRKTLCSLILFVYIYTLVEHFIILQASRWLAYAASSRSSLFSCPHWSNQPRHRTSGRHGLRTRELNKIVWQFIQSILSFYRNCTLVSVTVSRQWSISSHISYCKFWRSFPAFSWRLIQ